MTYTYTMSPRQERAHRLADRLRNGLDIDRHEMAAMIIELAENSRLIHTLLALRIMARNEMPYSDIVETINEELLPLRIEQELP